MKCKPSSTRVPKTLLKKLGLDAVTELHGLGKILCDNVNESILQWKNCFLNIMEQCILKNTLARHHNLHGLLKASLQ